MINWTFQHENDRILRNHFGKKSDERVIKKLEKVIFTNINTYIIASCYWYYLTLLEVHFVIYSIEY